MQVLRKMSKIFSTRCGEETESARGVKSFSANRLSLIHIPRFSTSQIPGGTWQLAAVPLPGVLSGSPNLWLLRTGGGLLAITAGALAFFATLYNRRRAQERLHETSRQAEARFEALAENAQDPIVSADSRGNIIYFNKAAQRAFGYEVSEVLGKPLTLLMPERFRDQHVVGMNSVCRPRRNRTPSQE